MTSRVRLILAVLALVLLGVLAIIFRQYMLAYLVRPIALLLWAIWRVFLSIHQNVYWTLLVLFCLAFALRLLPAEQFPLGTQDPYSYKRRDRISYWRQLLKDGLGSAREHNPLHERVRRMFMLVLSHTERSGLDDLDDLALEGETELTEKARHYLRSQETRKPGGGRGIMKSVRLRTAFMNRRRRDEESISEILDWMESRMEMHKDG